MTTTSTTTTSDIFSEKKESNKDSKTIVLKDKVQLRLFDGDIKRVETLEEAYERTKKDTNIWKISFSVGNDAFRLVRDYHNKQLWGNLVITTTSVDGKRPTTEDVLIPLPPHILNYLQKVGFKIKK